MTAALDIIGKKFNKVTVLRRHYSNSKAGKAKFECLCDCGIPFNAIGSSLLSGHTVSCGCHKANIMATHRIKPPGHAAYAIKYNVCKRSAKNRNLEFTLTKEQHAELIGQICYWCDDPPPDYNPYVSPSFSTRKHKLSQSAVDRSWIKANGIDRVDNTKGYTIDNCVPCCKECNESKSDRTVEDFIARAHRIANKDNKRKNNAA